eukprot:14583947-Ditylum_brightwellii.AAC.1
MTGGVIVPITAVLAWTVVKGCGALAELSAEFASREASLGRLLFLTVLMCSLFTTGLARLRLECYPTYVAAGVDKGVESDGTQTTWTRDWNPDMNVDDVNNADVIGMQTGSSDPMPSKCRLLIN